MIYPFAKKTQSDFKIVQTSGYGYRRHPISGKWILHRGVDFAPIKNIGGKIEVVATVDGTVQNFKDQYGAFCTMIRGVDGQGHLTVHHSHFLKESGSSVKIGDPIAYMGTTGNSTGVHVHLETRTRWWDAGSHYNPNPFYFFEQNTMLDFNEFLEWNKNIEQRGLCAEVAIVQEKPGNIGLIKNTNELTQDQKIFLCRLKDFNDSVPESVKNTAWFDTVMERYGSVYLRRSSSV